MSRGNVIELAGITKSFRHFALVDIDLVLEPGTIMGFIGANGAGKSTTLRIIMGLVTADRGDVRVLGYRIPEQQAAAKWDIGFASEDMRLYPSRSLQWHIDFCRSVYDRWDHGYAAALLERFDVRAEQTIKSMSRGQRVKAGLLLVLARRPRLLILDEPTTGLDPVARSEILDELLDVLRDERRSVLFSSHNTQDIEQVSDRIVFIDRGRVIASDDKEAYLEKWRRIRVEVDESIELPKLPGTVVSQRRGQLAVLTTRAYDEEMTTALTNTGAAVRSIESMTLEEVFVAEVKSSRTEGRAS